MSSTPYIAGKNIDVPPSALSDVVNPANQRSFARIFMAKAEHMRAAIDAADAGARSACNGLQLSALDSGISAKVLGEKKARS